MYPQSGRERPGGVPADAKAMSIALRCEPPILVDAEECSWAIRPRLRRFSWRLLPKRGEQLTQVGAWQKLGGWASKEAPPRPPPWTLRVKTLPTLTRPQRQATRLEGTWGLRPPATRPGDAGLRTGAGTRYTGLWDQGDSRTLTTEERQALMGLPEGGHTGTQTPGNSSLATPFTRGCWPGCWKTYLGHDPQGPLGGAPVWGS